MKVLNDDISSVELIDSMGTDMRVVQAARVSFNRETKGAEKDKELLKFLIKEKHFGPFEHVEFTFKVTAPIFVVRQWFRHRTWAYNEISRRYTSENIQFYVPTEARFTGSEDKQSSIITANFISDARHFFMEDLIKKHSETSVRAYNEMLDVGIAREMARMVLPTNMYTSFYGTIDLRNLFGFLQQRLDTHAQYEIRRYAEEILKLIQPVVPWSVDAWEGLNVSA